MMMELNVQDCVFTRIFKDEALQNKLKYLATTKSIDNEFVLGRDLWHIREVLEALSFKETQRDIFVKDVGQFTVEMRILSGQNVKLNTYFVVGSLKINGLVFDVLDTGNIGFSQQGLERVNDFLVTDISKAISSINCLNNVEIMPY